MVLVALFHGLWLLMACLASIVPELVVILEVRFDQEGCQDAVRVDSFKKRDEFMMKQCRKVEGVETVHMREPEKESLRSYPW
jgi:hypothetical protein